MKNSGNYNLIIKNPINGSVDNLVRVVVNRELKLLKSKKYSEKDGDEIWLVFDIDDEYAQNPKKITDSLELAKTNKLNIAWSNRCFELWFLLHFTEVTYEKNCNAELKKYLFRESYQYEKNKNLKKLFQILIKNTDTAIKNAKKFELDQFTKNPSTRVFEIISKLNLK